MSGLSTSPPWSGSEVQVPDPRVAGTFERRVILELGMEALTALPIRQRAVLAMIHYEGMVFDAVATALRLSVEEVRAQHAQATQCPPRAPRRPPRSLNLPSVRHNEPLCALLPSSI